MKGCVINGCDNPCQVSKGGTSTLGRVVKPYSFKYCSKHLGDRNRQGWIIRRKPDRYKDKNGYIQIFVDGKRIAEHRHVMQQKLGRPLTINESVHHINGNREDNKPDNLELWLGAIRYGQRASEVICPHCDKPYLANPLELIL